jgi:hypothetical protein
MRRGNIFSRFFHDLGEGDPVALGAAAVFALFLLIVGFVAYRAWREEKREKERKDKKYGRK